MEKDQVAELCYHLPEAAHEQLCHTREEIRLLADLTARTGNGADHLQLSPNALARCFDRLADQLDCALQKSFWPSKGKGVRDISWTTADYSIESDSILVERAVPPRLAIEARDVRVVNRVRA